MVRLFGNVFDKVGRVNGWRVRVTLLLPAPAIVARLVFVRLDSRFNFSAGEMEALQTGRKAKGGRPLPL